jgi:hypothetical protein
MAANSFDRKTLGFGAKRLEDGIHLSAWFEAPKLSTGEPGSYKVDMIVDPRTRGLEKPRFSVSRNGSKYRAAHGAGVDGLRAFAYEVRDIFLTSDAWKILKDRAPDPHFSVNHLGQMFQTKASP